HHCGYSVPAATVCSSCASGRLTSVGFGTERLEEELRRLLPAARISRLDRDTAVSRGDFYRVLQEVREGAVDVLIGTQMITKGHHFPGVTLVGVVWADAGLGLPDYKAGERTFQLLSQVMGRAGRGERPGRVIIQAMRPEHYSVDCARRHDYAGFVGREMELRREFAFPPFSRLAGILFEGDSEELTREAAMAAKGVLARHGRGLLVLGPAPAPLYRLRDRYRWQCLLKSASSELLHRACREVRQGHGSSRVKLAVDIDPENLL
ncbi:MAG: primosomal protein N', partial [Thermodesulfobacteriota bacterium]